MNKDRSGSSVIQPDKKRKKQVLGKGLGALIPAGDPVAAEPGEGAKEYQMCEIDHLVPNPYQPRRVFEEAELAELSRSIGEQGVIQPLVVRRAASGYELVAGERRLRAARMAGLTRVPVVVRTVSDRQLLEMSLVENIQRENLNPVEECDAYHRLISEFDMTQEQVARRVGKSRSAVANFLRIKGLPPEIRDSLSEGRLSMGHAKVLMGVEGTARQLEIWQKILARGLSVRETEQLAAAQKIPPAPPPPDQPSSEEIYFSDVSDRLSRRLGTKVQIRRRGRKGRLEIEFYSDNDLERLLEMLQGDGVSLDAY